MNPKFNLTEQKVLRFCSEMRGAEIGNTLLVFSRQVNLMPATAVIRFTEKER